MHKPQTILITGASSGLGKSLAILYAKQKHTLFLMGRHPERLQETHEICKKHGATVYSHPLCVTETENMRQQIHTWDNLVPINLVITNAGISGGTSSFLERDEAQFRQIMNINFNGTLNTFFPLLSRMEERKKGHIALVSSMAGFRGLPNAPAYSVSKNAVRILGEALRPLLKRKGIHLSTIYPGFIQTPLTEVNTFPMPFLMSAEEAAKRIKKGLEKKSAKIAFPWPMLLTSRFIAFLPRCCGDWILMRAPKKHLYQGKNSDDK